MEYQPMFGWVSDFLLNLKLNVAHIVFHITCLTFVSPLLDSEGNRTYGMANPGYMPAAEGGPGKTSKGVIQV